jgi:uncharacterized protein with GYD domain
VEALNTPTICRLSHSGRHQILAIAPAGGKLLHYYATTGEYDVLIISEAPDGADAVIAGMAAAASGAVSHVVTTRAWTSSEFKTMAERAQKALTSYRAPGA